MKTRTVVLTVFPAFALCAGGVGVWIASLPSGAAPAAAAAIAPIASDEAEATLAALRPRKRARPLVAVVGINDATETTDYLMPYGILRRSGILYDSEAELCRWRSPIAQHSAHSPELEHRNRAMRALLQVCRNLQAFRRVPFLIQVIE